MRFHSAHIDNLRKLYVDQIRHMHSAETQITEALPKMIEAASDPELKRILQTHLQETREQVSRLQTILERTPGTPEPKHSKAMACIIDDGNDMIADSKNDPVRDAAIITAGQRV